MGIGILPKSACLSLYRQFPSAKFFHVGSISFIWCGMHVNRHNQFCSYLFSISCQTNCAHSNDFMNESSVREPAASVKWTENMSMEHFEWINWAWFSVFTRIFYFIIVIWVITSHTDPANRFPRWHFHILNFIWTDGQKYINGPWCRM